MNQEPHRNQCRRRVPDQSRLLAEPPPLVRTVEEQAKLRGRSEEGAHAAMDRLGQPCACDQYGTPMPGLLRPDWAPSPRPAR
jgi:hypothetical protein